MRKVGSVRAVRNENFLVHVIFFFVLYYAPEFLLRIVQLFLLKVYWNTEIVCAGLNFLTSITEKLGR